VSQQPDCISLSTAQQFEQERMMRTIDGTSDPETLRSIAKMLVQAWMTQRAAASWAIREASRNRYRN
jgi:hypothetical protein